MVYLLIVSGYKYHSIASEKDSPECNFPFSALLISYHCVQLALEVIIILLIAYCFLFGCKDF